MSKVRYQKMYTEKYKQDMDFVIIGDYYLGPFIDMDVAQKAVSAINKQLAPQPNCTEIEYEKVEFNHAWELVKQFEVYNDIYYKSSSTPTYERMSLENIKNILCNKFPVSLYRKVEKEIDWREEVITFVKQNNANSGNFNVGYECEEKFLTDEQFLEMCRVALRATGELE